MGTDQRHEFKNVKIKSYRTVGLGMKVRLK
jgi:hypothetical protein